MEPSLRAASCGLGAPLLLGGLMSPQGPTQLSRCGGNGQMTPHLAGRGLLLPLQ